LFADLDGVHAVGAHLNFRHVIQADALDDAAKVHPPDAQIAFGGDFLDLSWTR
jgi:hypothetical protein